jgi:hypothetical protein
MKTKWDLFMVLALLAMLADPRRDYRLIIHVAS